MKALDTSIFDDAVLDVHELLRAYPSEQVEEAMLYIVDEKCINELEGIRKLLEMEYGYLHDNQKDDTKRRGKKTYQPYSLDEIVKIINQEEAANSFQTFVAQSWKQINDRKKVFASLETEFEKHKNKVRKFTKASLKKNNVASDAQKTILNHIESELIEQEKELNYIIENFEELDVRISSYHERVSYAALHWYVKKKRQKDVNLRKQVPNVLWVETLSEDEKIKADNELIHYIGKAKRAFGDVYYLEGLRQNKSKINLTDKE